jgi:hypothetical protein
MKATKHPARCSLCNRQMSQSECHFCSPMRAYWSHLSFSPGESCLPLRKRDMEVYVRLSRSLVLWRTLITTVHFLAIYPSATKRDEAVTFEMLVPTHQTVIYHISLLFAKFKSNLSIFWNKEWHILINWHITEEAGIAQAVKRYATGWTIRGSNTCRGRDFPHTSRPAPGAHPATCTMGTESFPGVKRPGRWADHPPASSAEVEGRVELYICSPSGPSWPVIRRALPLPYVRFWCTDIDWTE